MTVTFPDLNLRVNDMVQERISIRMSVEDGYPCGPKRLVTADPLLGEIVLTDQCAIEYQWRGGPWTKARVDDMIEFLEKLSATNGVIA